MTLFKKFSLSITARGIVAIINFLILIVSSRYLGVETRGQISLIILNIANVQMISEVFTGYALVHFIPKYALKRIFVAGLVWILMVVSTGGVLLYYLNYLIPHYEWHFVVSCFLVILNTFCMVIILGKENIRLYNWLSIFQPLLLLIILLFNIFVEKNYLLDAYFDGLFYSFGFVLILSLFSVVNYIKKESQKLFELKKILSNGFLSQWSVWMHLLSNRFSFYILSSIELQWLGVYSTATSLIESVFVIYSGISAVVLSYVSNEKDNERSLNITIKAAAGSFLITLMALIVILLIPEEWILMILGKGFMHIKLPMMVLSIGVLLISYSAIFSHYFSARGIIKYNAISNTTASIVSMLLCVFLIRDWGILGAALAGSISYSIEAILMIYFFVKSERIGFNRLCSIRL